MKFQKGNAGGPGRPPKVVEADYAAAVKRAVSVTDLTAILKAIGAKARKGDVQAAKLLLAYALGLPTDISTAERLSTLEKLANELTQTRQN